LPNDPSHNRTNEVEKKCKIGIHMRWRANSSHKTDTNEDIIPQTPMWGIRRDRRTNKS